MRRFRSIVRVLVLVLTWTVSGNDSRAANWPTWRGPNRNGISTETNAPTRWSRTENVRWRTGLTEWGNSSPIVWRDTVFITQTTRHLRSLLAYDRHNGKLRWSGTVESRVLAPTSRSNPYCAASPVTDGERVVTWYGSDGLHAFDLDGNRQWDLDLGPQRHQWGYGSSPVLAGDRIYLNFGPGAEEFIVAVDKRTGRELWRTRGPVAPAEDVNGTWSTPLLVKVNDQPQLLVALRDYFAGLDPETGLEIWHCDGMGPLAKASPIAGDGIAVMSGDTRGGEIAVRLGGRGDVTETHRLWREAPPRSRIASGIVRDGRIYGAQAGGILDCLTLDGGDTIWAERQKGAGANSAIWASPILVGQLLYFVNQGGDTMIVEASPKFNLVAVNRIDEFCNASPAIAYGDLFLRTYSALWCIRGSADEPELVPAPAAAGSTNPGAPARPAPPGRSP